MPEKKISAVARPVKALGAYRGITAAKAIAIAEAELKALRAWMEIDPNTPYREETAHRLVELADKIKRQP